MIVMILYKNITLLVSLLLVAKCKPRMRINFGGGISDPKPGVHSWYDHPLDSAAIVIPGTNVESQAHTELTTAQHNLEEAKSHLPGKSTLSDEKREYIKSKLIQNKGPIKELELGYRSLLASIREFEHELPAEWKVKAEIGKQKHIWDYLHDLKSFHRHHFSSLIRAHVNELGGLGSSMTRVGPGPGNEEVEEVSSIAFQEAMSHPDALRGSKRPHLDPVDVSQEPQNAPPRGKHGRMKQRSKLSAQKPESLRVHINKQDGQGPSNSQVLAERKMTGLLDESQELPDGLTHIIREKARLGTVQDLQKILCSPIFPNLEKHGIPFQKHRLYFKTSFERLVFKTLDFLFHLQLVTKEEFRSFFKSPEVLELTARHMSDLFAPREDMFFAYHAFVPDMRFLIGDWHTEHMHRCLQGLEKIDRQNIIYAALKMTIQALNGKWEKKSHRTPESISCNELFCKEAFLKEFNDEKAQGDLLMRTIHGVIKLFEKFPDNPTLEGSTKTVEFQINYYLLHFMRSYGNKGVRALINKHSEPMLFKAKWYFFTASVKLHQLVKKYEDFVYMSLYIKYHPNEARKETLSSSWSWDSELYKKARVRWKKYKQLNIEIFQTQANSQEDNGAFDHWKRTWPVPKFLLEVGIEAIKHQEFKGTIHNRNLWNIGINNVFGDIRNPGILRELFSKPGT